MGFVIGAILLGYLLFFIWVFSAISPTGPADPMVFLFLFFMLGLPGLMLTLKGIIELTGERLPALNRIYPPFLKVCGAYLVILGILIFFIHQY